MTTHETLVAAKAHLLNYGWRQRALGRLGEPCCLVGAVFAVNGGRSDANFEVSLGTVMDALSDEWQRDAVRFNNSPDRTFDDVIAVLDRAILATAPIDAPNPEPVTA